MNINQYKNKLPPVIVQSHLESQFDLIHKTQEVVEFYTDSMLQVWTGKLPKDIALTHVAYINQQLKLPAKGKNFGLTMSMNMPYVRKNIATLEKEVRYNNDTEVIVSKGMSLKQLALLIQLDSMYQFQMGALATYMYVVHPFMRATIKGYKEKSTAKEIKDFLVTREGFIKVANISMIENAKYKKVLADASNVTITAANHVLLHDDLAPELKEVLANTTISSFNQNPIMWIRSAFIGMFSDTYTELEDKRRYLELSLRQLENEKRGSKDPAIDKEMAMIKERIRATEYKMKKIMEKSNEK